MVHDPHFIYTAQKREAFPSKVGLKYQPCVWTQNRLSSALESKSFQSASGRLQFDPILTEMISLYEVQQMQKPSFSTLIRISDLNN